MFGLICPIVEGIYKKSIKDLNNKSSIITLQGITHIVIEENNLDSKYSKEQLKKEAYKILKDNNLLSLPAAGVLYINYLDRNIIKLIPIVFVKKINTLFYETACGSGTVAIGIYVSYRRKKSVNLDIIQPSGNIIKVETIVDDKKIYQARISGKVIEYQKENFVKYQDLITVKMMNLKTCNEVFVDIPRRGKSVIGKYVTSLNEKEYSLVIRVRKKVLEKLLEVDKLLKEINADYQVMVVYGYRSMEKQIEYFNSEIEKYQKDFTKEIDLYEFVHEKIAVPSVSGHPTGGAVDVVIYNMKKKKIIDFGTKVHDFDDSKSYVYYTNISLKAQNNRLLLRKIMMQVGFAPYDGEWWHFSYGDREWAYYYKKKKYLYPQVGKSIVYKS